MRYIALVDMNAYFASCMQQAFRNLRCKPVGVSRKPLDKTIIASASYEAKEFGIKNGMATWVAKEMCPKLIIVPGDPWMFAYSSSRIYGILKEFSPLVEVFSIDEAWVDITQVSQQIGSPVKTAYAIKQRIKKELGPFYRCSIGIASTKTMSKIAAEKKKPDGLIWIKDEEFPYWLNRLEVDAACGIAGATKEKLNSMGIKTLAELGKLICPGSGLPLE
ncbi:hypothetical protein HYR54_15180 [Candidatus Acetothermia bacterium]|nr:hypothetical protein [Candidatus Acetothermia bacterium]